MLITEAQKQRNRESCRAYYRTHREQILSRNKIWRETRKAEHRAYMKRWHAEHPGQGNKTQRIRYGTHLNRFYKTEQYYGLSKEGYEDLLAKQNGVCAICKKPCATHKHLSVDHDHETGEIRGLLCLNCNRGIGALQDSIDLVRAALEYLEATSAN